MVARGQGVTADGDKVSFWDDKMLLKLTVVMASQLCEYTTNNLIVYLKQVNCTVHELHLHKAVSRTTEAQYSNQQTTFHEKGRGRT